MYVNEVNGLSPWINIRNIDFHMENISVAIFDIVDEIKKILLFLFYAI